MAPTTVLIAEDERLVAEDISSNLKALGYAVCATVTSGKKAIDEANRHAPDIVLMDIVLKGQMDGVEAANQIRIQFDIPVVYLTAHASEEILQRAKTASPFGYIVKPFRKRELRTAIEVALYRHKTEKALKQSEQWLFTALRSIGEGVTAIDSRGCVTFMNPVAQSLTGWSEEEAVGKPLKDIFNVVHEMTREEVENPAVKVVETGRAVELGDFTLLIAKDGTDIPLEVTANPITGKQGNTVGAVMVFRDIRQRRRTEAETRILQAQVQEAQKVEAISTLAGGMAHEYNNALAAIAGSVELLKMDLAEDEDILSYIEPISRSTRRMAKLTSQLLAFARGGKYGPKTLCLNDFVTETLPIFRDAIDPAIAIETDVASCISCVEADPTQMQMVISSVLNNASEATNGSGRIIISATEEEVDEELVKKHPDLKQGRYVHLSVRDSGNGMDEETRNRIFEPFFTTKFQGRGLGMAAVYGIIRNHYGGIWVDSEPGKGTVVHIYLPCVDPEKIDVEKPKPELARGTGTILLIEDEEPLMRVTRKMLERLGYRVLAAQSGKKAVQTATDHDGDIDLAILDVGLPDKWGTDVYDLIREVRPGLRVIVTSGYGMDSPAQELFKAGVDGFIQKPYSLATLSGKVKDILERK